MTFQYTKKVMREFMHPKNMGEIKNADGIGLVGNPYCLLPDEKIYLSNNFNEIKNAKKGDGVISYNSSEDRILDSFNREYIGKVIILKNKLGKISITPEHLVYAIRLPNEIKYLRNKWKRTLIPAWYHAEQLKKRDIILYPIPDIERDIKFLKIDIPKSKWDFRSKLIPNKIPINSDLMKLFGYFLSEGGIQDKPSKTFISIALNIKELDIIEDIRKICKNLFSINIKIKEYPKRKTSVVFIYNAQIARWFKRLFSNGAENKKLPDFIMNLPKIKQKDLIFSLWKGDGYVNLNRNSPRAGYVTISYQLAQQIKFLLFRLGIIPSIYEEKEKTSKWAKHKKAYRIHVGQRDSLDRLCKILKIKYNPKSYKSIDSWIEKGYIHTPITKIEEKKYSGKVYNLEVEKTHSFISEAFTLHNCGDQMKVYIKIGKKKVGGKKQKFIKDIKFKTFGCMAAISTSSMITQLAKGKTLEKAKKITRDDVSISLGRLPPIKEHCSNLASDALHASIEDYEKKDKNKRKEKK